MWKILNKIATINHTNIMEVVVGRQAHPHAARFKHFCAANVRRPRYVWIWLIWLQRFFADSFSAKRSVYKAGDVVWYPIKRARQPRRRAGRLAGGRNRSTNLFIFDNIITRFTMHGKAGQTARLGPLGEEVFYCSVILGTDRKCRRATSREAAE